MCHLLGESRDDECCYCGEDISDGPSWPTWPSKMCGACCKDQFRRD